MTRSASGPWKPKANPELVVSLYIWVHVKSRAKTWALTGTKTSYASMHVGVSEVPEQTSGTRVCRDVGISRVLITKFAALFWKRLRMV